MRLKRYKIIALSILASLLLHLSLGEGLSRFAGFFANPSPRPQSMVELIDIPKSEDELRLKMKQIDTKQIFVRQADVPEKNLTDLELEARFVSEKRQRVLLETKAQAAGMTANRAQLNTKPNVKKISRKNSFSPKIGIAAIENDLNLSNLGDISQRVVKAGGFVPNLDVSTVGERLPSDIKAANLTALNSDQYLYYSFYSRLQELLRARWIQYTQAAIESNPKAAKRYARDSELLCSYEFVLDAKGNFLRALALNLSGFDGFDQAIVKTFRDVGRIPNPPKDLVRADGTVRLPFQLSAVLNQLIASP
jgi:hypothetical protein